MHDVVYILRNNPANVDELRYSLRSLANFEHGDVWIAGGIPDKITPDKEFAIRQQGVSKWERTTFTLRKFCEAKETPDTFWLFNDDFFVLRETKDMLPRYNGTLAQRVKAIGHSQYARELKKTMDALQARGLGINNYAVHVPMLLEKRKVIEVLDEFKGWPMFRSLYGNYWNIGGEDKPDVKIATNGTRPTEDMQFVSTSDVSFKYGLVGTALRQLFKEPSRWEHG